MAALLVKPVPVPFLGRCKREKNEMQRICRLILLALLALSLGSAAWGQDQKAQFNVIPPTQPASTIKGIKITESGFDPETKTLKLAFMNDSAADITAYHYCFTILSAN